ncbi:MAG: DUF6273 domain-containing protein [Lachnospiraceae bacterium]|nr:DUF6273 domain-containing protein [Lachnospiraceae bacterium]
MKIIRFFKTLPVTILSVIAIIAIASFYMWTIYTSDGKWSYDAITSELSFVDRDNNKVTNKEVRYQNDYYYIDNYGQKVVDRIINGKYYKEDGKRIQNKFYDIYGATFYFDKDGQVVNNSWITYNDKKYYADDYGKILKDTWIDDTYYVGKDGVLLTNAVAPDGTHVDENGKYYFVNDYNVDVDNIKKGDIIKLGTYKQSKIGYEYKDADESHYNVDDIEWIVLSNDNGCLKMISKYVLDVLEYNYKSVDVTWEKSDIRRWLSDTFMRMAFSRNDLDLFIPYENQNYGNDIYGVPSSEATYDKIFLLSKEECRQYYGIGDVATGINEDLLCKPTPYAMKDTLYVENGYANYWLRNNGCDMQNVMNVQFSGVIDNQGVSVCAKNMGIRPVIYVDFKKGLGR